MFVHDGDRPRPRRRQRQARGRLRPHSRVTRRRPAACANGCGRAPRRRRGAKYCSPCVARLPKRECVVCHVEFPPDMMTGPRCKPCASKTAWAKRIEDTYGITAEQYLELLEFQDGRCYICHRRPASKRLAVDHDHGTGEVRGLLCKACNRDVLGHLRDDAAALAAGHRLPDRDPGQAAVGRRRPDPTDPGVMMVDRVHDHCSLRWSRLRRLRRRLGSAAVSGSDIEDQPDYPYPFIAGRRPGRAAAGPPDDVDGHSFSFPCQPFTTACHLRDAQGGKSSTRTCSPRGRSDRVRVVVGDSVRGRERRRHQAAPPVMAPRSGEYLITLCGSMFGLGRPASPAVPRQLPAAPARPDGAGRLRPTGVPARHVPHRPEGAAEAGGRLPRPRRPGPQRWAHPRRRARAAGDGLAPDPAVGQAQGGVPSGVHVVASRPTSFGRPCDRDEAGPAPGPRPTTGSRSGTWATATSSSSAPRTGGPAVVLGPRREGAVELQGVSRHRRCVHDHRATRGTGVP